MPHAVTRFADGFRRRSFTSDEILALQAIERIDEDENFELFDGDVVPMQSKTHRHELIKSAMTIGLARALPDDLWLGIESTMYLARNSLLEPDLVIYPRGLELEQVKGDDIVLAIEVAVTTLRYDLGRKAVLYARYGLRELWVVDAKCLITHIHRAPQGGRWTSVEILTGAQPLTHAALPGFAMRLSDL